MSYRGTSAICDHLDHCFVVFKNVQLSSEVKSFCACDNVIHIRQFLNFSVTASFRFGVSVGVGALVITSCSTSQHLIIDLFYSTVISQTLMMFFEECNTSITVSHRSRAGISFHSQTSIQRNNFRFCGTVRH